MAQAPSLYGPLAPGLVKTKLSYVKKTLYYMNEALNFVQTTLDYIKTLATKIQYQRYGIVCGGNPRICVHVEVNKPAAQAAGADPSR